MFSFGSSGPQPSARDRIKQQQKASKKEFRGTKRDLDKQYREMQREEAKVVTQIKKEAGVGGNRAIARQLAKQLVQLRTNMERIQTSKSQIGGMEMQVQAMAAQATTGLALGSAASAMKRTSDAVAKTNVPGLAREYAMVSERMGMTEEMMSDALASAFDDDEEEEEDVLGEVMGELGLEASAAMAGAGAVPMGAGVATGAAMGAPAVTAPVGRTAVAAGGGGGGRGGGGGSEADLAAMMAQLGMPSVPEGGS